jgi:hypothetical protein
MLMQRAQEGGGRALYPQVGAVYGAPPSDAIGRRGRCFWTAL